MMRWITLLISLCLLFGCANETRTRKIDMYNASGDMIGTAAFSESKDGVLIKLKMEGLKPGPHGIHVHELPKCTAPDFKSAGNHLNPEGKKHGLMNQEGAHLGDLPNVEADGSGKINTKLTLSDATMKDGKKSLLKGEGSSLVLTEKPDDGMTQPGGDSGKRIACGELKTKEEKTGNGPTDPTQLRGEKKEE